MDNFKNGRRFFRINTTLPFIAIKVDKDSHWDENKGEQDFYSLGVDYFDTKKKKYLEERKMAYKHDVKEAIKVFPLSENIFNLLLEKINLSQEVLILILNGISPFSESGLGYMKALQVIAKIKEPLNLEILGSKTTTNAILNGFDKKIINLIEQMVLLAKESTKKKLVAKHLLQAFPEDEIINKLKTTKGMSDLKSAFIGMNELILKITSIYNDYMTMIENKLNTPPIKTINLSCGGVRFNSNFKIKKNEMLLVRMEVSPPFIKDNPFLKGPELIDIMGKVVYSFFDNKTGTWSIAVNFDILSDKNFNQINAYIQNKELDDIKLNNFISACE